MEEQEEDVEEEQGRPGGGGGGGPGGGAGRPGREQEPHTILRGNAHVAGIFSFNLNQMKGFLLRDTLDTSVSRISASSRESSAAFWL